MGAQNLLRKMNLVKKKGAARSMMMMGEKCCCKSMDDDIIARGNDAAGARSAEIDGFRARRAGILS